MQQYLTQISRCPLFARIRTQDVLHALDLLSAKVDRYEKGAIVLHQGAPAGVFGVLLEGCAQAITSDVSGNHTLVSTFRPGDPFAVTFAFSGVSALPVSIVATESSAVLLIDSRKMAGRNQHEFPAHSLLFVNLIRILSGKNLQLNEKITVLSQRTTRDKLIAYLTLQQRRTGSSCFTIPLNRQELADYLCVDRSAMSAELSKMKKEGLISCRKNEFELLSLGGGEE